MLPWGHAAVGYLCYSGWCRWRHSLPPGGLAVIALAIGTQFPDLIDKPLSWSFTLLPTGRSLAHSLLTFGVLGIALLSIARRRGRTTTTAAFLAGYASHLAADALSVILTGGYYLSYLLYPLLELGEPEHDYSFIDFFTSLTLTPMLALGLVLTAIATVVWIRDGAPGLAELREFLTRANTQPIPDQE